MSAGLLLVALAAQQRRMNELAHQRRERDRRERERRQREEREAEARRRKRYDSSTKSKSFFDCINIEMQHDPELRDFFQELTSKIDEVRLESGKEIVKKGEELIEVVKKFEEKKSELEDKMRQANIELDKNGGVAEYHCPTSIEDHSYRNFRYISRSYRFNGIHLKLINVKDPDNKEFEDRYEDLKKKNEENLPEYESNQRKLRRKRFINKIPLLDSYNRERDIDSLSWKVKDYERQKEEEEKAKTELEVFKALTPEQKKLIADYLETCESIRKGCAAVAEAKREHERALPSRTDRKVLEEALDRMGKTGFTEEKLMDVFHKLDKVAIKRGRGEYESEYSRYYYNEVLESFVKYAYEEDPKFVERNFDEVIDQLDDRDERV